MREPVYAIILAAGTASRMGNLKQLLAIRNRPMLECVIKNVMKQNFTRVMAVIGHKASRIQEEVKVNNERFQWIVNHDYHTGQSSSLKIGLETIMKGKVHSPCHVMVFLGDQPFITSETIRYTYHEGRTLASSLKKPFVVRPSYKGAKGHPVFFGHMDKVSFSHLHGDEGGKPLMKYIRHKYKLPVNDDGVLLDIDNPEDYETLKKRR